NIVFDLLTPYRFNLRGRVIEQRLVGGLLGHWAVWTRQAVELLESCHEAAQRAHGIPEILLRRAISTTDPNPPIFGGANGFAGCLGGIHEVLRRQGLLEGIWCLDPAESLSRGQSEEIDRVIRLYPELNDDEFVAEHSSDWLRP